jgi:hypothetical protein
MTWHTNAGAKTVHVWPADADETLCGQSPQGYVHVELRCVYPSLRAFCTREASCPECVAVLAERYNLPDRHVRPVARRARRWNTAATALDQLVEDADGWLERTYPQTAQQADNAGTYTGTCVEATGGRVVLDNGEVAVKVTDHAALADPSELGTNYTVSAGAVRILEGDDRGP